MSLEVDTVGDVVTMTDAVGDWDSEMENDALSIIVDEDDTLVLSLDEGERDLEGSLVADAEGEPDVLGVLDTAPDSDNVSVGSEVVDVVGVTSREVEPLAEYDGDPLRVLEDVTETSPVHVIEEDTSMVVELETTSELVVVAVVERALVEDTVEELEAVQDVSVVTESLVEATPDALFDLLIDLVNVKDVVMETSAVLVGVVDGSGDALSVGESESVVDGDWELVGDCERVWDGDRDRDMRLPVKDRDWDVLREYVIDQLGVFDRLLEVLFVTDDVRLDVTALVTDPVTEDVTLGFELVCSSDRVVDVVNERSRDMDSETVPDNESVFDFDKDTSCEDVNDDVVVTLRVSDVSDVWEDDRLMLPSCVTDNVDDAVALRLRDCERDAVRDCVGDDDSVTSSLADPVVDIVLLDENVTECEFDKSSVPVWEGEEDSDFSFVCEGDIVTLDDSLRVNDMVPESDIEFVLEVDLLLEPLASVEMVNDDVHVLDGVTDSSSVGVADGDAVSEAAVGDISDVCDDVMESSRVSVLLNETLGRDGVTYRVCEPVREGVTDRASDGDREKLLVRLSTFENDGVSVPCEWDALTVSSRELDTELEMSLVAVRDFDEDLDEVTSYDCVREADGNE
jgi:hypothetical protein